MNGRPARHFVEPATLAARLRARRFTLARRALQAIVLLAFFGTAHWGWTLLGRPLLAGDLSAAKLAGVVPIADPFAALQVLATGRMPAAELLIGAAVALASYALVGGRAFCAWVCPMNVVTDAASWLRGRLGVAAGPEPVGLPSSTRYWLLALALVVSASAGVAAFEAFSPVAMLHRELVYGGGLGLLAAAGIFALDALALRHGWCGRLCPLGAFWSVVGRASLVRVGFDDASCTRCGDCVRVCPEPQVLHFGQAAARSMIASGECSNCGRCVEICPEGSLRFALRAAASGASRDHARNSHANHGGSR